MLRKLVLRFIVALAAAGALTASANPRPVLAATGPLCYVDKNAGGPDRDGNSWDTAFRNLQFALTDPNCTEIWVAEGVYKPASAGNRTYRFGIPEGVQVYGGFSGTEALRGQRDPSAHVTILSGDIDNDDTNTDGNNIAEITEDIKGDNSYHVVIMGSLLNPVTSSTVLDGFTITAGQANNPLTPDNEGGGLVCGGGGGAFECSPTLTNLIISGNYAALGGGGMFNEGTDGGISSPSLTYVYFHGNRANQGGAIYNQGQNGASSPILSHVTFEGNSAEGDGGAIYNDGSISGNSSSTLTNVTFIDNHASGNAGAIYNDGSGGYSAPTLTNVSFTGNSAGTAGGAMFNYGDSGTSSPALTNVTFSSNSAGLGGAMFNYSNGGTSSPMLIHATFSSNDANTGGAIYNDGFDGGTVAPSLTNVILWGDTNWLGEQTHEMYNLSASPTIDHSVVEGGCPDGSTCTNLITTDPKPGPLADNGGFTKTMSLIWGSSAIDAGDDATCVAAPVNGLDQRGITRPQGMHCDIGAVERVPPLPRADFESDGISDMGYFHPATGLWAILDSSEGFSYAAPRYYSWGQTGDILALGDYDGDGRMDPTVRRDPAGGQSAAYLMLLSTTGYDFAYTLTVPAGWPVGLGDRPVPGDYNGDGFSDPAIWRGNTGVWIIPLSPSFNTYRFYAWGAIGDTPVGADVDGDGQTDIGYWRPSTGVWGFLQSSQGYSYGSALFFSWGMSGDIAVMADYDGDGYADPATVIPPAGGQSRAYRILLSTLAYDPAQSVTVPAGWPGLNDTPVPADYDGDGKADAGIWRGNTGVWIIPTSSSGNSSYIFAAWGASGDQVAR